MSEQGQGPSSPEGESSLQDFREIETESRQMVAERNKIIAERDRLGRLQNIEKILETGPQDPEELVDLVNKASFREVRKHEISQKYGKGLIGKTRAFLAGEFDVGVGKADDKVRRSGWNKCAEAGRRASMSIFNRRVAGAAGTAAVLGVLTGGVGAAAGGVIFGSMAGRGTAEAIAAVRGKETGARMEILEAEKEHWHRLKELAGELSETENPDQKLELMTEITNLYHKQGESVLLKQMQTAEEKLGGEREALNKSRARWQLAGEIAGMGAGVGYSFLTGRFAAIDIDLWNKVDGQNIAHKVLKVDGVWHFAYNAAEKAAGIGGGATTNVLGEPAWKIAAATMERSVPVLMSAFAGAGVGRKVEEVRTKRQETREAEQQQSKYERGMETITQEKKSLEELKESARQKGKLFPQAGQIWEGRVIDPENPGKKIKFSYRIEEVKTNGTVDYSVLGRRGKVITSGSGGKIVDMLKADNVSQKYLKQEGVKITPTRMTKLAKDESLAGEVAAASTREAQIKIIARRVWQAKGSKERTEKKQKQDWRDAEWLYQQFFFEKEAVVKPTEVKKTPTGVDLFRKLAQITLARIPSYRELNLEDKTKREDIFKEKTRELWKEIFVHKNEDLDARSALGILKLAGIQIDLKKDVKRIPKSSKPTAKGIYIDVGGREGVVIEDEGGTAFLDHHDPEKSGINNSATKVTYESMIKLGLLERTDDLDRLVEFVTQMDNRAYSITKEEFENSSWQTLKGLQRFIDFEHLLQFFKDGENPTEDLLKEDLEKYGLEEGSKTKKRVIKNSRETFEKMENEGLIVPSKRYGNIAVNIGRRKLEGGFDAAEAYGCQAYIIWNPTKKGLFISTKEPITDNFSQGKRMRETMWFMEHGYRGPFTITLNEILEKMTDGHFPREARGELKKTLDEEEEEAKKKAA